jgi:Arc/MetJ family transcription regulator
MLHDMPTKRTSLLLDPDLVAAAADVLGTRRTTDTVRAALEQAVRRAHLDRLVAWELPDSATAELERRRAPRRAGR